MSDTEMVASDSVASPARLIDPLVFNIAILVVSSICTTLMCLLGTATNIVNIHLFRKQGYRDGVNVTLTALAVSDLGAVIFELVYSTIWNPYILEADLEVSKMAIKYITGYCHEYFTRVSSVITAFAALERCLCVTRPLKVKAMITTKVAIAVNLSIFILYCGYFFPQFYTMDFAWTFLPERNRTVYVVLFTSRNDSMFPISLYFTDMLFPYCTFLMLISCSAILYVKLKSKAKWRRLVSGSGERLSQVATKERKSGLLFMSVSIMCVVFLLPAYLLFTAIIFVKSMALNGYLSDISFLISAFTGLLKTANSSFTILIYYNLSTKYRLEFQKLVEKLKVVVKIRQEETSETQNISSRSLK
ncbi:hypothetical protein BgiBS90_034162 [Biomphalaria glabrata]|nr:hypothetical protein BgiBS90_034162 [Biomphalaria glabrata]